MFNLETTITILLIFVTLTHRRWLPWVLRYKVIRYFFIPVLLFSIWLGLIIYQSFKIENVFTLLTEEYSNQQLSTNETYELHQGDKIQGRFVASDNNLGIIGFRFWTFYRLNDDYIIFRIKEKNSDKWYYENNYKEDQFQPNQYFTFGFPTIDNSKGKEYIFEVESLQGKDGVGVGLSEIGPSFIVKYKYNRDSITSSKGNMISFSLLKIRNLINKPQFNAASFVYFLPLILYFIMLTPIYINIEKKIIVFLNKKKRFFYLNIPYINLKPLKIRIKKIIIPISQFDGTKTSSSIKDIIIPFLKQPITALFLLILGVIVDIVFISKGDMTVILLLFLFISVIRYYNLSPKTLFILAVFILALSSFFYYLKLSAISERAAAWSWVFLVLTLFFLYLFSKKKNI